VWVEGGGGIAGGGEPAGDLGAAEPASGGEAFERAGASAEDELLLEPVTNQFDREEWEW
jgi:hypothetical protein